MSIQSLLLVLDIQAQVQIVNKESGKVYFEGIAFYIPVDMLLMYIRKLQTKSDKFIIQV